MTKTHGQSWPKFSPEYGIWAHMIQRCTNPNHPAWKNYGGRGITVCERWRESFAAFFADMGQRPTGLFLDRTDNDGNYEPGNCRWTTRSVNNRNRRDSIYIEYRGERKHLSDWAAEIGVTHLALYKRLRNHPVEVALSKGARLNNTAGHKGVAQDKRSGKWYAQRVVEGMRLYAGQFDTAREAARAYKKLGE